MGDLSHITFPGRSAVSITVPPHWKDHHLEGRPILPAVEAMALLADHIHKVAPQYEVHTLNQARFGKFLPIAPDADHIEAFCDVDDFQKNTLYAALVTKVVSKSGTISRNIEHAGMLFSRWPNTPAPLPVDLTAALEGVCHYVDPDTIYRELVPFGPGFRSICAPLALNRSGALALVRAPELPDPGESPHLGSGFPLDGAFHAACIWGQRHAGLVAFPVGIEQRTVFTPTRSGETYLARVIPVQINGTVLSFDIHIMDRGGGLREIARGVEMRDVSQGRRRPPEGIVPKQTEPDQTDAWFPRCAGVVVIERTGIADFAPLSLSPAETARFAGMGAGRRNGFLSGRLALKRLWRRLAGNDLRRPAAEIETVAPHRLRPELPAVDGHPPYYYALSHDGVFAVAVAATVPVGVDVEKISPRAHGCRKLFMTPDERHLMRPENLSVHEAALRIWSVKEAAAKALDISPAEAWQRIEVSALTENASRFKNHDGKAATADHVTCRGHVFTIVTAP